MWPLNGNPAGIRDNDLFLRYRRLQEALNPEALQAFEFPLQILQCIFHIHVVSFQEPVNLVAGFKAKQASRSGLWRCPSLYSSANKAPRARRDRFSLSSGIWTVSSMLF
jgi:hypothetical protein